MSAVPGRRPTAARFDRHEDRHVITLKMNLDPQAWSAASEIVLDAWKRLEDVETEAANRRSTSGEDGIRTTVSLLSYESP
jgi:hypothetical protein